MNFDTYQQEAKKTAIYPDSSKVTYPVLGLASEAGEVAGKYKKVIRDQNGIMTAENVLDMKKELGDVLWYIVAIASDLDLTLSEIAQTNLDKLQKRHKSGTISGSGDDR